MSYDLIEFQRRARVLSDEHRRAVQDAEDTGILLAKAEAEYHKQLAVAVARLRPEGATVAETLAKGCDSVLTAREGKDVAAARDRTAMERIRLARDDRAVLLTMASWSKSQESWSR